MRIKVKCNNCLQSWYYDSALDAIAQFSYHYATEKHTNFAIDVA